MTAKVENYCAQKRNRSISVNASERACVNCIWYDQYYRQTRGNVSAWVPTSTTLPVARLHTRRTAQAMQRL